jgi:hypothetical protein
MTCVPVERVALLAIGVIALLAIVKAGGGKVNTNCGSTTPTQVTPYVNEPFTVTGAAGGAAVTPKLTRNVAEENPACAVAPS